MLLSIERMLILKSTEIFDGVDDEALAELAAGMAEHQLGRGETVMSQGERGRTIYVIVAGKVVVIRDGRRITELSSGDVVGELAAFDPAPRSATVVALEPTHLLELDNYQVESMMMHNIDMLRAVTRMLCRRLRGFESPT